MFKRYNFKWEDANKERHSLDFFVNFKSTKNGFMHRACAIGYIPRLDGNGSNFSQYQANETTLFKKRYCKSSYCNRTWESYPGHDCLMKLWNQLAALKFVDMSEICSLNPFDQESEPEHEDLWEPEDLFAPFTRR